MGFIKILDLYYRGIIPLIQWYEGYSLKGWPGMPPKGSSSSSSTGNVKGRVFFFHSQQEIISPPKRGESRGREGGGEMGVNSSQGRGNNNWMWWGSGSVWIAVPVHNKLKVWVTCAVADLVPSVTWMDMLYTDWASASKGLATTRVATPTWRSNCMSKLPGSAHKHTHRTR